MLVNVLGEMMVLVVVVVIVGIPFISFICTKNVNHHEATTPTTTIAEIGSMNMTHQLACALGTVQVARAHAHTLALAHAQCMLHNACCT